MSRLLIKDINFDRSFTLCPICLSDADEIKTCVKLECDHVICNHCIYQIRECPLCRYQIPLTTDQVILKIDSDLLILSKNDYSTIGDIQSWLLNKYGNMSLSDLWSLVKEGKRLNFELPLISFKSSSFHLLSTVPFNIIRGPTTNKFINHILPQHIMLILVTNDSINYQELLSLVKSSWSRNSELVEKWFNKILVKLELGEYIHLRDGYIRHNY